MSAIKIVFFDIDGTLIDMNKKRISEKMLETLRRLKENGILVRWFDADRIRNFVRITIGSQAQMTALVNTIAGLLQNR